MKPGHRAKTASNRSRRTDSTALAPAIARVQPSALRPRERRGLLDAPQGCSIAHSLIDLDGGSRSTAEDYWTRRQACSIARRRSDERGRRPLRFHGCGHERRGSHATTALLAARADRREAIKRCWRGERAARYPAIESSRSADRTSRTKEQRWFRRKPRWLCWPSGRSSRYDSLMGIKIKPTEETN